MFLSLPTRRNRSIAAPLFFIISFLCVRAGANLSIGLHLELFIMFVTSLFFEGIIWLIIVLGIFGAELPFVYHVFAFGISYWICAVGMFWALRMIRLSVWTLWSVFSAGVFVFFSIYALFLGIFSLDVFSFIHDLLIQSTLGLLCSWFLVHYVL